MAEAVIGTLDRSALRPSEELRPYRAVLGRLLPGWSGDAVGHPDIDPAVLLGEGLLRLLRALGETGCLLRLEDLHWADEDTIALVEHLAGAVSATPVMLAVSLRDDEGVAAARRLAAVPGVTALRLPRLGAAEVAALAAACRGGRPISPDDARRLLVRSEGLPFVVEELVAGDGVPPTLVVLVAGRLAALSSEQREVLGAAAVLGAELDWRLLTPTTGAPEPAVLAALRAAVDVGLLATGKQLGWSHALTRDAVLATLLPPERAVLARRAAQVLTERAGPDDEPRAAQLFGEAGELDAAAELLLRLARRDTARGALRSAEQLLARAAGTGARPAEVTAERVAVLTLIGRADDAIALGGAALDALAGDQHAELCLRLARAAVVAGRWTAAEDYVERSGRPNDPRSLVLRADAAFGAGRADEAAAIAAVAIERAGDTGAYTSLCEALGVSARAGVRSDPAAAGAALRRATQVAAAQGLTPWRVEAMAQLAMVEALTADEPALLRHARQLALDAGMLVQLVSIEFVLWEYTFEIEGPRATEAIARRALETVIPLQLPVLRANAEVVLAGCRGAGGDGPGMAELLDAALQRASGHPDVAAYASLADAIHALIDHDLHRAQHLADAAMSYLLGHQAAPPLHSFGLWALLRTATGDRDDEARQRIRSHPSSVRLANRAALGYADAIAAGRTGRADQAATGFAAADTLLAGQPWWRRVLRLVALEAAVVDGWGDPVPQLRADLAAHEAAGDTRLARTCRDLLRRAGQPTRRGRGRASVPPALRALGVTSREVDVLELVTAGLTNAQIAARLHLSPRSTVDTHVSSLLAKTGVAGRAGLGAFRLSQTR